MDIREKLVELMKEVIFPAFSGGGLDVKLKYQLPEHGFVAIADHLIANGVTVSEEALPVADKATERSVAVEKTEDQRKPEGFIGHRKLEQEWIPVTERKPDLELVEAKADDFDLYACLATIKNDRARSGRYVGKAWYDGKGFMDGDCVDITYEVTHWMPLPTPPKGE